MRFDSDGRWWDRDDSPKSEMDRKYPRFDYLGREWVNRYQKNYTRDERPYSYSEFYHKGGSIDSAGSSAVYSDHLVQYDSDKFRRCFQKHIPKGYVLATIDQLSKFMTEYNGYESNVTAVAEGCNCSNGFSYFIIWYDAPKEQQRKDAEDRREARRAAKKEQ